MGIPDDVRAFVTNRDNYRCAYCLTSEENCGLKMHIDHIIPEVAGGATSAENLCLACFTCNVHKGAKQTGVDPQSFIEVPLFHPLVQKWTTHFSWDETKTHILGLTPEGRATVLVLKMNNPIVIQARRRWVSAGWHPPTL